MFQMIFRSYVLYAFFLYTGGIYMGAIPYPTRFVSFVHHIQPDKFCEVCQNFLSVPRLWDVPLWKYLGEFCTLCTTLYPTRHVL